MNSKNIGKSLKAKLDNWVEHIDDPTIKKVVKENAMVSGGALVSLLTNEPVNDYDIYFKTYEACRAVADYYINKWNSKPGLDPFHKVYIDASTHDRVRLVIGGAPKVNDKGEAEIGRGYGMVAEEGETGIDDNTEPYTSENQEDPTKPNPTIVKPPYRPRFFSTNAISLSDGIQLVIRFTGAIDVIHENFDFEHTKCSYDYNTGNVNLPPRALECIINKELLYSGSKYPLTSIIRTRKFITRGWHISAGQYVKMALELNELDLKDMEVFKDQVVGVDSAYFMSAIDAIEKRMMKDPTFKIDNMYLFDVIDRIF